MAAQQPDDKARPRGRIAGTLRALCVQGTVLVLTLAAIEVALRVADLRFLREAGFTGQSVIYRHDPDLGWMPIANSQTKFAGSRVITVKHNSLGLRDIEPAPTTKPTILFVGDSFVWGYDVEAHERFTDIIRAQWPQVRVINAGVTGFGTDQDLLLLQHLWTTFTPKVVVLVLQIENDRKDNKTNSRYDLHYKPYFAQAADGGWELRGRPVPLSRHYYFANNPLAHNLWLARVAVAVYLQFSQPIVFVPDPTEHIVEMMRDYVEAHGARFLVGLPILENEIEDFMTAHKIAFTSLNGAETFPTDGFHWTPSGHKEIAARLMTILPQAGDLPRDLPRDLPAPGRRD